METKETVIVKEGLKYSTAAFIGLVVFILGFVVGFAVSRKYSPSIELPVVTVKTDTVTVRDTIAGKVLPPRIDSIIRVDTIRLQINPANGSGYQTDTTTRKSIPDTITRPRLQPDGTITIPISRKVYQTEDYRAVISGWRPSLDSMEVYGKTRTITTVERQTVVKDKPKTWALTVGPGAGYGTDKKFSPYVGVTLGFVIKSW